MKQEIVISKRQEKNDNEKVLERRRSSPVDSNKLVTAEMETQTITSPSPIKSKLRISSALQKTKLFHCIGRPSPKFSRRQRIS